MTRPPRERCWTKIKAEASPQSSKSDDRGKSEAWCNTQSLRTHSWPACVRTVCQWGAFCAMREFNWADEEDAQRKTALSLWSSNTRTRSKRAAGPTTEPNIQPSNPDGFIQWMKFLFHPQDYFYYYWLFEILLKNSCRFFCWWSTKQSVVLSSQFSRASSEYDTETDTLTWENKHTSALSAFPSGFIITQLSQSQPSRLVQLILCPTNLVLQQISCHHELKIIFCEIEKCDAETIPQK